MSELDPVAWLSPGGDVSRSKKYFEDMGFTNLVPLYRNAAQQVSDTARTESDLAPALACGAAPIDRGACSLKETCEADRRDAARWRKFNEVAKKHFNREQGRMEFYLPRLLGGYKSLEQALDEDYAAVPAVAALDALATPCPHCGQRPIDDMESF